MTLKEVPPDSNLNPKDPRHKLLCKKCIQDTSHVGKNYVSTLSPFSIKLTFTDVVPTCTVPPWKGNLFY